MKAEQQSVLAVSELLQAALAYAARGWPVLSVWGIGQDRQCMCAEGASCEYPGKHPILTQDGGGGGVTHATTAPDRIRAWWSAHPQANVAVATGARSGITVLDIDVADGKPGAATWAALIEKKGEPVTVTAETGSGGMHFFFKYNSALKTVSNALGPAVDCRNDNGYVVVAPSRHHSGGAYRWWRPIDTPLADLPAHLTRPLPQRRSPKKSSDARKLSLADVRAMLERVDADDRDRWRYVGIILGREYDRSDDAWAVYDEWAARSPKYNEKGTLKEMRKCFYEESVKPPADDGAELSIGSLVHWATEGGWTALRAAAGQRSGFTAAEGELGLARAFAERHAGGLLYSCADKTWLRYEAGAWRELQRQQQVDMAMALQRDLLADAQQRERDNPNDPGVRAYHKFAVTMQKGRVTDVILAKASADPRLAVEGPQMFDRDPALLNAINGVVDLSTGRLLPHDPAHRMRKQARASFLEGGEPPHLWLRYLNDVTCGDVEFIAYFRRMFGLFLTGHVKAEVLFFFFGEGNAGKSLFFKVIEFILGNYVVVMPPGFLMEAGYKKPADAPSPAMMMLVGARVALATETGSRDELSETTVKNVAAIDSITARALHAKATTFAPTHKMVVRGNHKPRIVDTDSGLWRRVQLIPFNRVYSDDEKDPQLFEKLTTEADAILTWAVAGAVEFSATFKFTSCRSVRAATEEYRTDSDLLGQWIAEECELGPRATHWVKAPLAFDSYRQWCGRQGMKPLTASTLTRRLKERGIAHERRRDARQMVYFYDGLKVGF